MLRFGFEIISQPQHLALMSNVVGSAIPLHASLDEPQEQSGSPSPREHKLLEIFDETRLALLRYLLSMHLPPEQAEEIIQESYLRLFSHLTDRRIRENARGWLFRVAHNLALRWKQDQAEKGDVTRLLDLAETEYRDPALSPEDLVLLSERDRRLIELVSQLPEQEQTCLQLRAEGLRYREIARTLNLGVTTVADVLRRAIRRLQEGLQ
jgi:RNA polymerase sigma-70 factor (ECF subfamily)